ncbi:2-oxo acid dehydrogenase subunit E2 [Mycobacterium sp. PS03-16]|uniref:dihydrolipoamide acetyltransferase family protein n=1 Tax=Mycobacterium sp. PS03-16 TaxID=2559611 RepID=UPI0010743AF2|nr:dihydrolipoamide acetyltransferase family protein [Mycobacterium sp. PS03-16]TFV59698.1 2-oxo acid dehydrogenase subunit E2 [Mycobacterium sp. PS03-16]
MTVHDFAVPDLGEGLQDATITSWAVDVGDEVQLNQTLCTVETNKAEVEIPSPYAGRVVERGGEEGQTLDVGAVLVRIASDTGAPAEPATPVRQPVLVGYGADGAMDVSRRTARPVTGRARAKPSVRRLAADHGVDLSAVAPSGPDGIVTRDDVLAAAGRVEARGGTHAVRGVQAEMARRMTLSRHEIPDAHAAVEVDGSALLRLRDRLHAADERITPFVLTLRLLTLALRHHPVLNATWLETADGPQIHSHSAIHLGFGVAAPRGLLVPVVTDAQDKTTRELAAAVARLVAQAREGTVAPRDLSGSTFTVSNFGALGLDDGVPVINHPEAAILGMGSLKLRPVVVDGAVTARPTMRLTCAFDHRVADGAQVAAFLAELRALLEAPESALLDL